MDNITPIKFWCYKVLPLVYDDSLSYYEVLCKLVAKVNDVISVTNQIPDAIPDAIANVFKDSDTINPVLQKIFSDIKNSISNNDEMSSTTVTTNYKAGDLVWQNDKLYRVLKNVEAGDRWVDGSNYTSVTIEEMIRVVYNSDEKTLYVRGIVNGTVEKPLPSVSVTGDTHKYIPDQKAIEIISGKEEN